jgi:alpha-1,2-mannosyltransferase
LTAWWTSVAGAGRGSGAPVGSAVPEPAGVPGKVQASAVVRVAGTLAALALLLSGLHTLTGLVTGPDLVVYWKGGWCVLHGQSLYGPGFVHAGVYRPYLFTYTPFAALLFAPLALLQLPWAMAVWTTGEAAALLVIVRLSMGRAASAFPARTRAVVLLLAWSGCLVLVPIQEGVQLGQVDLFVALLAFVDVVAQRPRWPRGVLLGVATAVKLTPGLFLVHLAATRQWRVLANALLTLAVCWGTAALVLPGATADFFFRGVMFDTTRVGDAAKSINQSLHGLVLRLGLPAPGVWWVLLSAAVISYGLARARRAHAAGDRRAEAVLVGLVILLVSPISWLHHAVWVVPMTAVLVTSGRRAFLALGAAFALILLYVTPAQHGITSEAYVLVYLVALVVLPVRPAGQPAG